MDVAVLAVMNLSFGASEKRIPIKENALRYRDVLGSKLINPFLWMMEH
jgi:hypothetical protein